MNLGLLSSPMSNVVPPLELKSRVLSYKYSKFVGRTIDLYFGVSVCGQHYAVLITKVLWYKVRIFIENEYPDCSISWLPVGPTAEINRKEQDVFAVSQHTTQEGAMQTKQKYMDFFNAPTMKMANILMKDAGYMNPFFRRNIPSDWAEDPDKYLKRGDILLRPLLSILNHAAIYTGDGKVVHISKISNRSPDNSEENNLRAMEGVLRCEPGTKDVSFFVDRKDASFQIIYFPLRCRNREDIAKAAEDYAKKNFGDGCYHFLFKNCLNFAILCATGDETVVGTHVYYDNQIEYRLLRYEFELFMKIVGNFLNKRKNRS